MFLPGGILIYTACVCQCVSVSSNLCRPINFIFSGDLRISMGGLLVWGMVVDLTHGFGDSRFSDMLPRLGKIRGVGNQVFLMSWTRPRNF